jgi:thioredoxin 1
MVHDVKTEEEFKSKIKGTAIVDFYADWCGPCKAIAPEFARLSQAYPNITFLKVNVDHLQSVAKQYSVSAMPTFIFFQNGQQKETVLGADLQKIKSMLTKYNSASNSFSGSSGRVLGSGKTVPGSNNSSTKADGNLLFFGIVGLLILYL